MDVKSISREMYTVASERDPHKRYIVRLYEGDAHCECPHFEHRGVECKHIKAVRASLLAPVAEPAPPPVIGLGAALVAVTNAVDALAEAQFRYERENAVYEAALIRRGDAQRVLDRAEAAFRQALDAERAAREHQVAARTRAWREAADA